MRFVANVLSGFDDTMGATFFDLTELQVRCINPATSLLCGHAGDLASPRHAAANLTTTSCATMPGTYSPARRHPQISLVGLSACLLSLQENDT